MAEVYHYHLLGLSRSFTLDELRQAPVTRHDLTPLLAGAWPRHDSLRVTDAFYVELAHKADLVLLTTDQRLARAWPAADAIA